MLVRIRAAIFEAKGTEAAVASSVGAGQRETSIEVKKDRFAARAAIVEYVLHAYAVNANVRTVTAACHVAWSALVLGNRLTVPIGAENAVGANAFVAGYHGASQSAFFASGSRSSNLSHVEEALTTRLHATPNFLRVANDIRTHSCFGDEANGSR